MTAERDTSRSGAALRWAASLIEPLLTTRQRDAFDIAFADVAENDPTWFSNYTAGVITGIVQALPVADPWRSVEVNSNRTPLWPDGRRFGSRADTYDVAVPVPELDEAGVDPSTLALEDTVRPGSARIIILAFGGWAKTRDDLAWTHLNEGASEMFSQATDAIRWAQHRRRAYNPIGTADAWLEFLVNEWLHWAQETIDTGTTNGFEHELQRMYREERSVLASWRPPKR